MRAHLLDGVALGAPGLEKSSSLGSVAYKTIERDVKNSDHNGETRGEAYRTLSGASVARARKGVTFAQQPKSRSPEGEERNNQRVSCAGMSGRRTFSEEFEGWNEMLLEQNKKNLARFIPGALTHGIAAATP